MLDHYRDFAYCDPDQYPVTEQGGEERHAREWWEQADKSSPEVRALMSRHGYSEPPDHADIEMYRDHKKFMVIRMTPAPGGFDYELPIGDRRPSQTVFGFVSRDGRIDERRREARQGGCPICLERGTRIATPRGDVLVERLRRGQMVWSRDTTGARVAVGVQRVVRRPVVGRHLMTRIALSDGRMVISAAAHPLADGRRVGSLHRGERLDGARITRIELIASDEPATYDFLPAGTTDVYFANGIPLGSTLS